MRRLAPWFFGLLVFVVLGFIMIVLIWPATGTKVTPLGNLVLVLATLVYAWLTFALVQQTARTVEAMSEGNRISREVIAEMQESRRQAATPVVTAEWHQTSGSSAFFYVRNHGNSPALNIEIGLRVHPLPPGVAPTMVILTRKSILSPGAEFLVEADLGPYRGNQNIRAYVVNADYANILNEGFEWETEFPRTPDGLIGHATRHGLVERTPVHQ